MPRRTRETQEQLDAFEYYFLLGDNRTLKAVAEHVGKSMSAIEGWSSKFKWHKRLLDRQTQIFNKRRAKNDQIYRDTHETVFQDINNYTNVLNAILAKVFKRVKNKKGEYEQIVAIEITDTQELTKVVDCLYKLARFKINLVEKFGDPDARQTIENILNRRALEGWDIQQTIGEFVKAGVGPPDFIVKEFQVELGLLGGQDGEQDKPDAAEQAAVDERIAEMLQPKNLKLLGGSK